MSSGWDLEPVALLKMFVISQHPFLDRVDWRSHTTLSQAYQRRLFVPFATAVVSLAYIALGETDDEDAAALVPCVVALACQIIWNGCAAK
eukprot:730293-Amphidinium_carterae.1